MMGHEPAKRPGPLLPMTGIPARSAQPALICPIVPAGLPSIAGKPWAGLLTHAFFPDNIFVNTNMTASLTTTHTLFRAFAEETRLRMLSLLLERELCVCELCEILKVSQPNVSRHLGYLRRAGLVAMRQEGKWKYYAVTRKPTGLHRALLDCVQDCLRGFDVLQKDLRQLRKITLRCGR